MKIIRIILIAASAVVSFALSIIIVLMTLDYHDRVNSSEDSIWELFIAPLMAAMISYILMNLALYFINKQK